MDNARFDRLARAFSASRRGTIKALLSSAFGALILSHSGEEAAAG